VEEAKKLSVLRNRITLTRIDQIIKIFRGYLQKKGIINGIKDCIRLDKEFIGEMN